MIFCRRSVSRFGRWRPRNSAWPGSPKSLFENSHFLGAPARQEPHPTKNASVGRGSRRAFCWKALKIRSFQTGSKSLFEKCICLVCLSSVSLASLLLAYRCVPICSLVAPRQADARRRIRSKAIFQTGSKAIPGAGVVILLLFCLLAPGAPKLFASDVNATNAALLFTIRAYAVEGKPFIVADELRSVFSNYTGTNLGVEELVGAAEALQIEYRNQGYPAVSVAIAPQVLNDGVLTLHVFQGAIPQILVSGKPYLRPTNGTATLSTTTNALTSQAVGIAGANAGPTGRTNVEPRFAVRGYEVTGNSLLPLETLQSTLWKYTGTNIGFTDIASAVKDLQKEYHARGYDTVSVTIPQQRLTNAIFKIRIFEGRLAEIVVSGNHFYSSNNVMRSLPSLRTNVFLNSFLFQAELDRANANQDRQVYPEIRPGPEVNTTALILGVKDRLPLHGKLELNNQNSPGTPDLRLNGSLVYNNLWQADHSFGLQYSGSPELYKGGDQWNFYDRPLVANYSSFYRLPLGSPGSMADEINARPGAFGYSEATRKFALPPASGVPELNFYASRSTIDTGVQSGALTQLASTNTLGATTLDQRTDHEDLTINQGFGFRLTEPLPEFGGIRSSLQAGLDFKSYKVSSFATNDFIFTQFLTDTAGNPFTRVSVTPSPVPTTTRSIDYLPLSLRWDGSRQDKQGRTDFGFGYSPNLWYSNGKNNLQNIAGSSRASGYWHTLTASLAREQTIRGEWKLALRADGQWASEPLISNEQFGVGGVNGVRGYREGEVFGSTGWRVTSELKTPPYRVGYVGSGTRRPLSVRASAFMDYAELYALDAQPGQQGRTPLWGTGLGAVASVGPAFEARLLFSVPLLSTPAWEANQLRFAFDLSAQF